MAAAFCRYYISYFTVCLPRVKYYGCSGCSPELSWARPSRACSSHLQTDYVKPVPITESSCMWHAAQLLQGTSSTCGPAAPDGPAKPDCLALATSIFP